MNGGGPDILLVNLHHDGWGHLNGGLTIGLNSLAVYLRERGYDAAIRMRTYRHGDDLVAGAKGVPKSVGFYCDNENETLVEGLSAAVKEAHGVPVFVGGPQAAELGEAFLRRSRCDAVVRGEGEITLAELMDSFIRGGKKLCDISGVTRLDATGEIVRTPDRKPIGDLDSLPGCDYRLESGHENWNSFPVMTGRGCPYACAFCHEGAGSKKVRYRSAARVLDEIRTHFSRHPQCRYLYFIDDTFTLDPRRVAEFCDGLSKLRREIDFVWFCEGHVQTLARDPEMLYRMADAGLAKLFIGVESGSDMVLSLYRKRTGRDMILKVVTEACAAQIPHVAGNIIIGGPKECPETMAESVSLSLELLRAAPGVYDTAGFFFNPYPGTAITLAPEKFGMKVLREKIRYSLEDIPLSESDSMDWNGVMNARLEFNRAVQAEMRTMFREGKVPEETIIRSYRLLSRYGVYSRWISQVYPQDPVKNGYFTLIAEGSLSASCRVPENEFRNWRPQRVFDACGHISFEDGYPAIAGKPLSPLEYDLLLRCSGRSSFSAVVDGSFAKFGRLFDGIGEFEIRAREILDGFENDRMIAYSRF